MIQVSEGSSRGVKLGQWGRRVRDLAVFWGCWWISATTEELLESNGVPRFLSLLVFAAALLLTSIASVIILTMAPFFWTAWKQRSRTDGGRARDVGQLNDGRREPSRSSR